MFRTALDSRLRGNDKSKEYPEMLGWLNLSPRA